MSIDPMLIALVLALLLVIVGFAGMVLPAMPGTPILFAGLLLAAWAEDFQHVGTGTLSVIGLLGVLAYAVDFIAGAVGAKRFGASPRAMLGAALGALVGIFFGLPGILLGPFAGAVLGELSARRSLGEASRAGLGATLGMAVGAAAKIAIGLSMLGVFVIVRFF